MKSSTIPKLFQERVRLSENRLAIKRKVGENWVDISWSEYGENVRCFALGLISLGLEPQSAVSTLGYNSPEWVYADIAAMSLGA
ncbi:MAG: AMP-binding protein, partial [Candidatus Abyssubacteria bacterium]|nr:AMP-binding protein [Candidatus Abyssubacteria bacterium]